MATNNPKVVGYVSPEIAEQLEALRIKRGLKSVSQALTVVLSEYFNPQSGTLVDHQLKDRVEALEDKISRLAEEVTQLNWLTRSTSGTLVEHVGQSGTLVEHVGQSGTLVEHSSEGISQRELCDRFQIDSKSVSKVAEKQGMNAQQHLERLTGWQYRVKLGQTRGKFYPPAEVEQN